MDSCNYLEIRMHESDREGWLGPLAYEQFVQHLWKSGAPGVTVFRAAEGLDAKGHIQNIDVEYSSENLPITLQVVATNAQINRILSEAEEELPKYGQAYLNQDVFNLKEYKMGEISMDDGGILKIYMKEEDKFDHIPLYHALVVALRKRDILWVNVQKALEGFGEDHVIHQNKFFQLADDAPVVVEVAVGAGEWNGLAEEIGHLIELASGPAIFIKGNIIGVGKKKPNH